MTHFTVPLRVSSQPRSDLEHKENEMRGWRLTLIVTIGLNSWTHSAAADAHQAPAPRPTLNLELRNMTTLSPAALAEARATLTQIYHAAGIGVQWKTVGADFTVFVISTPLPLYASPASLSDMCRATTPSAAVKHLSSRIALGTGRASLSCPSSSFWD